MFLSTFKLYLLMTSIVDEQWTVEIDSRNFGLFKLLWISRNMLLLLAAVEADVLVYMKLSFRATISTPQNAHFIDCCCCWCVGMLEIEFSGHYGLLKVLFLSVAFAVDVLAVPHEIDRVFELLYPTPENGPFIGCFCCWCVANSLSTPSKWSFYLLLLLRLLMC